MPSGGDLGRGATIKLGRWPSETTTIDADGSINFGLIYGVVKCTPTSSSYPYTFDHDVWGLGAMVASGTGVIYLSGADWNYFFNNTAGFEVAGVSGGGGVLQITFFNSSAIPIGQFTAACGGIGSFGSGGKGGWQSS